jgi:hypothetical protein
MPAKSPTVSTFSVVDNTQLTTALKAAPQRKRSLNVASITIGSLGMLFLNKDAVSSPLISGMRESRMIKSGCSPWAFSRASRPLAGHGQSGG